MKLSYVGVDLAKNVFQLHGIDRHGQAAWRRRLRRKQWLKVLLETAEPGCIIGMEACSSAPPLGTAAAGPWLRRAVSRPAVRQEQQE
jgi:hypothetical protein